MRDFRMGAKRATAGVVALLLVGAVLALAPAAPAGAVHLPQVGLVSDDPANWTPHVLNGRVNAVAQVGNTVYLGGSFSQVRADNSGTVLGRSNFMAFDATNGAVLPLAPQFDGEVTTILPAPDGQSLYVAGRFDRLGTQSSRGLARISTATGAPVAGFNVPSLNGAVRDLRLVGNRLILAGAFTHVAGVLQLGLATVNATTGAFDPYMGVTISGNHAGGTTQVLKIDVTPDGSRLFAVGNFSAVNGQTRRQVFAVDLGAGSASLAGWTTSFYGATCSSSFDSYMRDLDVSPDGSFVVFTTTGAYGGGPPRPCDTHARFEVAGSSSIDPTWVHYTGGDTSQAVAITGDVVYVGGHFRWANNPLAGDRAGAGAVDRPGLVALDPENGVPLSWNPTRTLGVGVFDIVSTPTGLWVASDTDRIGNYEFHGRIAFFPLAGGTAVPAKQQGVFPGRVHLLDPPTQNNAVRGRFYDGTTAGPVETFPSGGINWDAARAAVMVDGTVYAAFGDTAGTFNAYTFDGTQWGPADPVDTSDQLVRDSSWHSDVRSMTGLFYDRGHLYYTLSNNSSLYSRAFSTESQIVSPQRVTVSGSVSGLSFSTVRGMFLGGDHLYWTDANGNLRRAVWSGGRPVSGTAQLVSGPTTDGVDWRAKAIFLSTERLPGSPNEEPVAVADVSCSGLDCSADAGDSTDADGTITTYEWDFGDGTAPVEGITASHAYEAAGTYTVTLTVTDDLGATGTATQEVTVEDVESAISFVGAGSANANAVNHDVAVPPGVQAGDALLLFVAANSADIDVSAPTGAATWTSVGAAGTSGMESSVWRATASGPGGTVRVTTSVFAKVGLTLLAYRDVAPEVVAAFDGAGESSSTSTHATPTVAAAGGGQWAVSLWAHEDSSSTALTPAAGVTTRATTAGTGGGRILTAAADSGGPVGAGPYGDRAATASGASRHAAMWTVLLAPAGPPPPPPPNQAPTAVASVSCAGLVCEFDGTDSTDDAPGLSYSWDFGDGDTAVGGNVAHGYPAAGSYTATLTVTDAGGLTATDQVTVDVTVPGTAEIAFVGAGTADANSTVHSVGLPGGVAAGDGLLLFASSNNAAAALSTPTGGGSWTLVDQIGTDGLVTAVWKATATGTGTTASLTSSATAKVSLIVLAYRGTAGDPVASVARAVESATTAVHTTPGAATVAPGAWVVSYWAHKDSSATTLTPEGGVTDRASTVGTGGGRVLATAADSGGPLAASADAGRSATASSASRHGTMWTIVLAPA